jgi:type II secretory pathway component PulC
VSFDREDAAILEVGGTQKIVARGEKIGGWTLASVSTERIELVGSGATKVIYIDPADQPARATPPRPAAGRAAPRGGPKLGLAGAFRWIVGGPALPPPFDKVARAFVVTRVEDGSLAARADVRSDDQLLAVDGVALRSTDQLLGASTALANGQAVTLTVARRGDITRTKVVP